MRTELWKKSFKHVLAGQILSVASSFEVHLEISGGETGRPASGSVIKRICLRSILKRAGWVAPRSFGSIREGKSKLLNFQLKSCYSNRSQLPNRIIFYFTTRAPIGTYFLLYLATVYIRRYKIEEF